MDFATVSSLLLYHGGMLADEVRTGSLRRAIEETVRPGDVVVDLGAGTGILAMFAARAGAARVYAIEQGPIVRVAEELVASNRLNDRVKLVHAESYEVELPERADVLITETLWNFGLGEGMLGFVSDARARFLNPGARVIPMTLDLYTAPVQTTKLWETIAWPAERGGVDLTAARPYALNNLYQMDAQPDVLLAAAEMLTSVNLATTDKRDVCGTAEFVSRAGTIHGFVGFFNAGLSASVNLTNGPPKGTSSWAHTFLPLERPLEVAEHQRVGVRVETAANGSVWRWRTEVDGETVFDQSTMWGFPLDLAGLEHRDS